MTVLDTLLDRMLRQHAVPVHLHFHDADDRLLDRLDSLTLDIRALLAQGEKLMPVLKDVQAQLDSLAKAVATNTSVGGSIVTLLKGLTTMIADLRQQLADAIAANDPAAIQAVLDALTALETSVAADTKALADAAVQNTPTP